MNNFIVRLIACFIFNRKKRSKFRQKHLRPSNRDKMKKLDSLIYQIEQFNHVSKDVEYIKNFLLATTDITKTPPAHGVLELMQQCSLQLLKRFDTIARKYGIEYWLDAGTLVGAVRHNGFVPWDDDIDICVLRSDYEKLDDILTKEFKDSDYHFSQGDIIRCFYKKTPAQLDVLPIDQGWQSEELYGKDKQEFIDKLNDIKESLHYQFFPNLEQQISTLSEQDRKRALMARDTILLGNHKKKSDGFCFSGVETQAANRALWSYNDIFPLKKITFYDIEVSVPNNVLVYLFKMYGDFMRFPVDTYPKHVDIQSRVNQATIQDMKDFIAKQKGATV